MKKNLEKNLVVMAPEENEKDEYYLEQVVRWLMPWYKKTDGAERIGDWEMSLPLTMMKNLLRLWLTEDGMIKVEKMLHVYHPLDRAAMAYAALVFILTGHKMEFKATFAKHHFFMLCSVVKENMAELTFSNHMKYMLRKYGKKRTLK
ncbi:MAG: hypothetical protein IJV42_05785 [Bacteroidaceae bacterium]|nr:hypothetical protein [Bacteroidaceae bacterium]